MLEQTLAMTPVHLMALVGRNCIGRLRYSRPDQVEQGGGLEFFRDDPLCVSMRQVGPVQHPEALPCHVTVEDQALVPFARHLRACA